MRKIVLIILAFTSFTGFTQNDDDDNIDAVQQLQPPTFWDNVRFGGGLGFGFGTNNTTINISPSAIYDFQNGFALGLSVGYLYAKNDAFRSNVISPGIITLYNPAEEIQLSAEFEHLFINQKFGSASDSFDYPALYLGVAYRTGWAAFGMRYDVLYDERDSVFGSAFSPIIRFYF